MSEPVEGRRAKGEGRSGTELSGLRLCARASGVRPSTLALRLCARASGLRPSPLALRLSPRP
jgi:hypothetical protein